MLSVLKTEHKASLKKIKDLEKKVKELEDELAEERKKSEVNLSLLKQLENLEKLIKSEFSTISSSSNVLGIVEKQIDKMNQMGEEMRKREEEMLAFFSKNKEYSQDFKNFIKLVKQFLKLREELRKKENEKIELEIDKGKTKDAKDLGDLDIKLKEINEVIRKLKEKIKELEKQIANYRGELWKRFGKKQEELENEKESCLDMIKELGTWERFTNSLQGKSFGNKKLDELLGSQEVISKGQDSDDGLLHGKIKEMFKKAPDKFVKKLKDLCKLKQEFVQLEMELKDIEKIIETFHINIQNIDIRGDVNQSMVGVSNTDMGNFSPQMFAQQQHVEDISK